MGSLSGSVYKGAVLCWGPKFLERNPNFKNCPYMNYTNTVEGSRSCMGDPAMLGVATALNAVAFAF